MIVQEKRTFETTTYLEAVDAAALGLGWVWSVLLSPPQIPAGLHYNSGDFELEEKNSVKSSGILRTI